MGNHSLKYHEADILMPDVQKEERRKSKGFWGLRLSSREPQGGWASWRHHIRLEAAPTFILDGVFNLRMIERFFGAGAVLVGCSAALPASAHLELAAQPAVTQKKSGIVKSRETESTCDA